jgi:hypothetical protein
MSAEPRKFKIIVNGKEYASLDQVPAELRDKLPLLEDKNRDGVPDILEGELKKAAIRMEDMRFQIEGKVFALPKDIPSDVKEDIEKVLRDGSNIARGVSIENQKDGWHLRFKTGKYQLQEIRGTGESAGQPPETQAPAGPKRHAPGVSNHAWQTSKSVGPPVEVIVLCILVFLGLAVFFLMHQPAYH